MAIAHIKTVDHILADGTHLTDEQMQHHNITDDHIIRVMINAAREFEKEKEGENRGLDSTKLAK